MNDKVKKFLLDIVFAAKEINTFIDTSNFNDFKENRLLQKAIEREFEIIGEYRRIISGKRKKGPWTQWD